MSLKVKRADGSQEPFLARYERFEKSIAEDDEYRESLLGADILASASPRYFEITVMRQMGYTITEWETLPLRVRAELIAGLKLSNMVEVLERHTLETRRKQREHGMTKNNMFTKAAEGRGQKQDYWQSGTS